MYHHYVVSKNWQRLPRNEMHYRPNHAWLCERNNTFRSSFCLTISLHIILWIFSFLVLLIHYPKITRLKGDGEWKQKQEQASERLIYSNYFILCTNRVLRKRDREKIITTFFALFPSCAYIFDGKRIRAYGPKCQRNISSLFPKSISVFSPLNPFLEEERKQSESKLKMNYECFVPVYQSIQLY